MCFDQYTEGLAILKEKEDKKLREAEERQKREEWESKRRLQGKRRRKNPRGNCICN